VQLIVCLLTNHVHLSCVAYSNAFNKLSSVVGSFLLDMNS